MHLWCALVLAPFPGVRSFKCVPSQTTKGWYNLQQEGAVSGCQFPPGLVNIATCRQGLAAFSSIVPSCSILNQLKESFAASLAAGNYPTTVECEPGTPPNDRLMIFPNLTGCEATNLVFEENTGVEDKGALREDSRSKSVLMQNFECVAAKRAAAGESLYFDPQPPHAHRLLTGTNYTEHVFSVAAMRRLVAVGEQTNNTDTVRCQDNDAEIAARYRSFGVTTCAAAAKMAGLREMCTGTMRAGALANCPRTCGMCAQTNHTPARPSSSKSVEPLQLFLLRGNPDVCRVPRNFDDITSMRFYVDCDANGYLYMLTHQVLSAAINRAGDLAAYFTFLSTEGGTSIHARVQSPAPVLRAADEEMPTTPTGHDGTPANHDGTTDNHDNTTAGHSRTPAAQNHTGTGHDRMVQPYLSLLDRRSCEALLERIQASGSSLTP